MRCADLRARRCDSIKHLAFYDTTPSPFVAVNSPPASAGALAALVHGSLVVQRGHTARSPAAGVRDAMSRSAVGAETTGTPPPCSSLEYVCGESLPSQRRPFLFAANHEQNTTTRPEPHANKKTKPRNPRNRRLQGNPRKPKKTQENPRKPKETQGNPTGMLGFLVFLVFLVLLHRALVRSRRELGAWGGCPKSGLKFCVK